MNDYLKIMMLGAALVAGPALVPETAHAGDDPVYTGVFSNVAVGGYDTVSFFDGEPLEGSKKFSTEWNGAEWRFASQQNLDRFLADPEAFAPQYGGYCAWAVAEGKLAKGSPQHWKIVDGKLYLNYNQSVQDTWLTDISGFILRGDDNWPTILD